MTGPIDRIWRYLGNADPESVTGPRKVMKLGSTPEVQFAAIVRFDAAATRGGLEPQILQES